MPSSAAACRAVASEREAMPRTSIHVLFCMAGITLTFAIFAVPRIPQTTFFICAVYSRQNEQHRLQFATVFYEGLSVRQCPGQLLYQHRTRHFVLEVSGRLIGVPFGLGRIVVFSPRFSSSNMD